MSAGAAGAGHGPADEYDPLPGRGPETDAEHHSEGDFLDGHRSDPPLPVSPGRRRLATIVAFLFIAIILTFLVWFIASNPTRRSSGGMLGAGPESFGWMKAG